MMRRAGSGIEKSSRLDVRLGPTSRFVAISVR
jgi:hypothetical protein